MFRNSPTHLVVLEDKRAVFTYCTLVGDDKFRYQGLSGYCTLRTNLIECSEDGDSRNVLIFDRRWVVSLSDQHYSNIQW